MHWACFLVAVGCDTSTTMQDSDCHCASLIPFHKIVPEWSLKISCSKNPWLRSLERPNTNTEDHSRMNLSVSVCPGRVRHFMSFRFIWVGIGRWTSWDTKMPYSNIFHYSTTLPTEFAPKLGGCACSKPWFSPYAKERMNDMQCALILLNFSAFIHPL